MSPRPRAEQVLELRAATWRDRRAHIAGRRSVRLGRHGKARCARLVYRGGDPEQEAATTATVMVDLDRARWVPVYFGPPDVAARVAQSSIVGPV